MTSADPPSADGPGLRRQLAAAEAALRRLARTAGPDDERATAQRHADVVAQIQRDFQDRPINGDAVGSTEAVGVLRAGDEALRAQTVGAGPAAAATPEDPRQPAERADAGAVLYTLRLPAGRFREGLR